MGKPIVITTSIVCIHKHTRTSTHRDTNTHKAQTHTQTHARNKDTRIQHKHTHTQHKLTISAYQHSNHQACARRTSLPVYTLCTNLAVLPAHAPPICPTPLLQQLHHSKPIA